MACGYLPWRRRRSPSNSATGPGGAHPLNRSKPRIVRVNAGNGATRFLVVSIRHGGNIRRSTSQETHRICCVKTRSIFIFLSLSQWLWSSEPVTAAETSAPNREAARRARVVVVQEPEATVTFNPQPEKISLMIRRGLTNLTGKATLQEAWL